MKTEQEIISLMLSHQRFILSLGVAKIAGMRDKLIHDYFGVDYSLVWDVVENKIDDLKCDLENIE